MVAIVSEAFAPMPPVIPSRLLCPLTAELMRDPVTASDGRTYDREAIESWFAAGHSSSPITGMTLPDRVIVPNPRARLAIDEFIAAFPEMRAHLYRLRDGGIIRAAISEATARAALPGRRDPEPPSLNSLVLVGDIECFGDVGGGLTRSDAMLSSSYATPDWRALGKRSLATDRRSGSSPTLLRRGGSSSRLTSGSSFTYDGEGDDPLALPPGLKISVAGKVTGKDAGWDLTVEFSSDFALQHLAARICAVGSAPLRSLKLSAPTAFTPGEDVHDVCTSGNGFALLTRALHASEGAPCLSSLKELSLSKLNLADAQASALADALLYHSSITRIEVFDVNLRDRGAYAIARLGAAGGSYALAELGLGRDLLTPDGERRVTAMVEPRVKLTFW